MRTWLFFIGCLSCVASTALAQSPSVSDFFSSMKGEFNGQSSQTDHKALFAVVLAIVAASMGLLALHHWKRRSTPRPGNKATPGSQKKLLAEASRLAGVNRAHMKQIESLTRDEGLSSPLVAIICPSVLKKLSQQAHTEHQKHALTAIARQLTKK